jgi:hypothetical protein
MSRYRLVTSDFPRSSSYWPKLLPVHLDVNITVTKLNRTIQMLYKNRHLKVQKLISLDLSVKDDNCDACKPRKWKKLMPRNLLKWDLTYYGGSSHERLLSESSRPYILVSCICIANSLTVHIFWSHVFKRKRNALHDIHKFHACGKTHNNKSVKWLAAGYLYSIIHDNNRWPYF